MVMTAPPEWQALPSFAFGDSPALADELLALVLAGGKTPTCWDAREGAKGTAPGMRMVVLDSAGVPRAVLETVALEKARFDAVEADFAFAEGEGDRSLAPWRADHQRYFARNGHFAPDMLLYCERFRLVATL